MRGGLLLCLAALLLSSCSPKSVDSYKNGQREEEILDLLNTREYGKAIWLIESRDGKQPSDPRRVFLLAEAYLGRAGFEPLSVAARVSGPQEFPTAEGRKIFPACTTAGLNGVRAVDGKCLLKRIYFNVPEADSRDFARARELLRLAYPSPADTPSWINVLIGAVELASCVKRVGHVYILSRELQEEQRGPSAEELQWFLAEKEKAEREKAEVLARASHDGNKIGRLLTGRRDSIWFQPLGSVQGFAPGLTLAPAFTILEKSRDSADSSPLTEIAQLLTQEEKNMDGGTTAPAAQP